MASPPWARPHHRSPHRSELSRLGSLKVKRQLAKDWGCITGNTARVTVNGVQRNSSTGHLSADLRAKFEAKYGKQEWTHDVTEWLGEVLGRLGRFLTNLPNELCSSHKGFR